MTPRDHARHIARGVLVGAAIAATVIGGLLALFLLVWGPTRFLADFWPLDNSRIGPNICASFTIAVLVIAHNEYRTTVKAFEKGENLRQVAHDLEVEVIHPAETAEQHIADGQ